MQAKPAMQWRESMFIVLMVLGAMMSGRALAAEPVVIGLDGEFGLEQSVSAQAVGLGMRTAMVEINAAGGVLGGRNLELLTKDHRSIPARGIRNLTEFAARFSPVVIEELPKIKELKLPFMAVWSSADPIVDNGMQPNEIRAALERVPQYRGLIKSYRPPFTPERHDALGTEELMLVCYRSDGVLIPA